MNKTEDTKEVMIAKLRVMRPLELRWICPDPKCGKVNTELRYSAPGDVHVTCRVCKQTFPGVRQ